MRTVLRLLLVLAVLAGALWLLLALGVGERPGGERPGGAAPSGASVAFPEPDAAAVAAARRELAGLATGFGGEGGRYDRSAFGRGWADLDADGCRTRNEILRRDLTGVSLFGNGCVVGSGTLVDPYGGETIAFRHGETTSAAVQIDHIVPLGYAWRQGAWRWSAAERLAFANDPRNLVAVAGEWNDDKGSDGPGRWLPPNTATHCGYAVRFVSLLSEYELDAFPADERELARLLRGCGSAETGSAAAAAPAASIARSTRARSAFARSAKPRCSAT